tara:strand:+ start:11096 stop:11494 length:399 start_codon:yes stop_codon:yes gene_type:complete
MAHGKSPGYDAGNHWFTCDVCGFDFRASQGKKRWENFWVCHKDWETRQPQDFVRGRKDKITPSNPLRPVPIENFVAAFCNAYTSSVVDCCIVDCNVVDDPFVVDNSVPAGSFGDYLDGTIVGDNFAEEDVLE